MRPDRLHAETPPSGSDPGRRPDPATPPDLDQLWRDFNQRINSWFGLGRAPRPPQPGRVPRWRPSLPLVLGVLLLLSWLGSGWRSVGPGQQATLSLLGRRTAIVGPGQHWYWPAPFGRARQYDVQTPRRLEVGAGDGDDGGPLLSRDRRLVDLRLQLVYRIADLPAYLDHAAAPDLQLAALAQSLLRVDVAGADADKLLGADHAGIAATLQQQLQPALAAADLGLQLQQVSVVQALPPIAVLAAADTLQQQLIAARQLLQQERALAQQQAKDDAAQLQRQLQLARADQDQQLQQARDDAERFIALLPSYAHAPQATLDSLRQQTLRAVLQRAQKVVVDASRTHPVIQITASAATPASAPLAAAPPAAAASAGSVVFPPRELTRDRDLR